MHFDARAAKLLEPGRHLLIEGCDGLRLVASASRKSWIYRFKSPVDGRMRQIVIGQWPSVSVQAAVVEWARLRDRRQAGGDPALERKAARVARQAAAAPAPSVMTVRRVVDDYIAGRLLPGRQARGGAAAQRALVRLLDEEPDFAATPAEALTRAQAFDVLDRRSGTPTAAAKLRSMLGSAWDYALDAGRLPDGVANWWRLVLRGQLKSRGKIIGGEHVAGARRVLSAAEVGQLLAWSGNMHALGRDCLVIYLWTGTRGVEFLAARPEHVQAEGALLWWTVPKAQTKNHRRADAVDLRVPLFGRAREVMERRLAAVGASGWLFEDVRREQYTQHDFSTYIYNLQPYAPKVAGRQGAGLVLPVTHWTPHNLRRTARTLLAGLGCPNEVGEAIVGHMPAEIIGTYNRYSYDAERVLWLQRLSDHLEALAAAAGAPARP
jgi:integrase